MDCSVVIPHFDRLPMLQWTLRSLARQQTKYLFEVIVVDDGSPVRPMDQLRASELPAVTRFINQRNQGAAAARNAGAEAAQAPIVIFLDCDQIAPPTFIDNHMIPFRSVDAPMLQLGTRRNLYRGAELDLDAMTALRFRADERFPFLHRTSFNLSNLGVGWHLGFSHNMSIRRADFLDHGGFDAGFVGWGFEDTELTYRLHCAGVRPIFNPMVEVFHQFHKQAITPTKFQQWRKNLDYFIEKHPTAEVCLQNVLVPIVNPRQRDPRPWAKGLLQMEALHRVSQGRPIQTVIESRTPCDTFEDLQAFAARNHGPEVAAVLPIRKLGLIARAQLDPTFDHVRIVFA